MIDMTEGITSGTRLKDDGTDGSTGPTVRTSSMAETGEDTAGRKGRLAVLASGRGSDFQAIVDSMERGDIDLDLALLVCNNPDAFVIERAKLHSIPYILIDHRGKTREAFDMEINEVLVEANIDLIALAGFMRILSPAFVRLWEHRIVNIHPALLPSFPGTHAQRDALEHGVKVTGLTVHFVDEKMDHGPIIFQYPVEVEDDDTEESLSMRILEKEHQWYPLILERIIKGRYSIVGRKVTLKDH